MSKDGSRTPSARPLGRIGLRRWGQALKDEGNPLGESLLAYADAWDADVNAMAQEIRDTARGASEEAHWKAAQGEEYGSY